MASTKRLEVRQPILTDADLEKIRSISDVADTHFKSHALDTTFHAGFGAAGMEQVLDELCARAEGAVREASTSSSCPTAWRARTGFRSLALGLRRRASSSDPHRFAHLGRLVVESGEPREVHHFACLAGYGAEERSIRIWRSKPSSR